MRYCGIVVGPRWQVVCALEELREPDPPVRLAATFFEPAPVPEVIAGLRALGEVTVAVAAPLTRPRASGAQRECDAELARRRVAPVAPLAAALELREGLADLGLFAPAAPGTPVGRVPDGAFGTARLLETNVDGVFCALRGRRVPARRHPLGVHIRIQELESDHVVDPGGGLWARRIEEVDAAAAALCAHRYAVGHASWLGDPAEGVVVLPGASVPAAFPQDGVLPPVVRLPLVA